MQKMIYKIDDVINTDIGIFKNMSFDFGIDTGILDYDFLVKYGKRNINSFLASFLNDAGTLTQAQAQTMCNHIELHFTGKWNRYKDTLERVYDYQKPFVETETTTTENKSGIYGFNDDTATGDAEYKTTVSRERNYNNTQLPENIINAELESAKKIFIDFVFEDVVDYISLQIFDMED